jgi:hypothetical protein
MDVPYVLKDRFSGILVKICVKYLVEKDIEYKY